jgi:hypothetical protein
VDVALEVVDTEEVELVLAVVALDVAATAAPLGCDPAVN